MGESDIDGSDRRISIPWIHRKGGTGSHYSWINVTGST